MEQEITFDTLKVYKLQLKAYKNLKETELTKELMFIKLIEDMKFHWAIMSGEDKEEAIKYAKELGVDVVMDNAVVENI